MKNIITRSTLIVALLLSMQYLLVAQTYSLTVNGGYGSGSYPAGDTVNIWCHAIPVAQIFDRWTGDSSLLESRDEWHTQFIMPARNVTVTANFKNIDTLHILHESIMGRDTLKEVYSYFPPNFKGVIFCFHGSGGSASNWTTLYEYRQFINDAVADTFAFIITEAEEVTKHTDFSGDGLLNWALLPYDSVTNVDFANIRILMDTFRLRGITNSSTKYYAVGMSNGGAVAPIIATLYHWSAAVSYCAQSSQILMNLTNVPIQWCMAKHDNNIHVGAAGDSAALDDYHTLKGRGICTNYFLHDHSPVYPQRFMRDGNIDSTTATRFFDELQNNQLLDANHFLLYASDSILLRVIASPLSFPTFLGLPLAEKGFVGSQIDAMYAAHQFYSDYNKRTLHFFDNPCDSSWLPTAIPQLNMSGDGFIIYPNPTNDELTIQRNGSEKADEALLTDISGRLIVRILLYSQKTRLSLSNLPSGIYLLKAGNSVRKVIRN